MLDRLCVVSNDRQWAESLREFFFHRYRISCCERIVALDHLHCDVFQCLVIRPRCELEFQQACAVPEQLWRREIIVPTLIVADACSLQLKDWPWQCTSELISSSAPMQLLGKRLDRLVRCWQPLRDAAPSTWSFLRRATQLSPRERFVMDRLTDGWWIKRIAQALGTTPHTVRNQRANVLKKLQVDSDRELLRLSLNARWLSAMAGPPSQAHI